MAKFSGGSARADRALAEAWLDTLWLSRSLMDHLVAEELAELPFNFDVTMPQYRTLVAVRHLSPCGIAELAERVQTTTASMSTMVDRLVAMKLLIRVRSKEDRRRVDVRLPRNVAMKMDRIDVNLQSKLADLFRPLSSEKKKALRLAAETLNDLLPDKIA